MTGLEWKRKQAAVRARKRLHNRVLRLSRRTQEWLGLERWDIKLSFYALPESVLGQNHCNPRYHEAEIVFDLDKLARKTPTEIDRVVLHEYADILLSPGRALAQSLWERVRDDTFEGMSVQIERLPAKRTGT